MAQFFECHPDGVVGRGPITADVMFVGVALGRDEWEKTKKPFTGPAGRFLDATLKACEFPVDDAYYTNLICWWRDAPTPQEIEECLPRLRSEIETVRPRLIVPLGAIACEAFGLTREYKKTFGGLRGGVYWFDKYQCWIMPTYHPSAFLYEDSHVNVADFARDILKIRDVLTWPVDGTHRPWEIQYTVVDNAEQADQALWTLEGACSIDVETSYENKDARYFDECTPEQRSAMPYYEPAGVTLLCATVSSEQGTWCIPGWLWSQVRPGWGSRPEVQWTMQAGMFDKAQMLHLLGERLTLSEDTLLQSYSLDERGGQAEEGERAVGIHGLKGLVKEYTGAGFYNIDVLKATQAQLHEYNAKDTVYTLALMHKFKARQIADGVRDMYLEILIPGANVLSEIQDRGCYIDGRVLGDLTEEWVPKWLQMEEELRAEAHELGWPVDKELNFNSSKQMQAFVYDFLKAPYTEEGRTTKNHVLELLAERYKIPWLQKLKDLRQLTHMIGTYIVGIEDDVKYGSRAHPEPLIHGSVGGRLSYHKPPVQTLPNRGVDPSLARLRKMFKATPRRFMQWLQYFGADNIRDAPLLTEIEEPDDDRSDYVIIEADLKQAELWATWMYSGDPALLAALESGDVHGETALEVFDTTVDNEFFYIHRYMTKVISFGILYGRGARSFSLDMWKGHPPPPGIPNFTWTVKEAQAYIDKWFRKYPRVARWRKEVQASAYKQGEQTSYTGRKRRYWKTDYQTMAQSVNYGPQSLAHDYLFMSLIELHPLLKPYDAHIWFEVHDALVIEANKAYLPQVLALVKQVMERPKFGLDRGIPVDIAVGDNWLETEKVKFDDDGNAVITNEAWLPVAA